MKDIIILAHYCGSLDDKSNSRFLELASMLSKEHKVEVITTDFLHGPKKHINAVDHKFPFKITLCHESGYPRNVCFKRFISHHQFGKNVKKYLHSREVPDVIFSAVPSLTAPYVTAKYCKQHNIRFVIDIQDLWPEAFKMVFNVPIISALVFAPFTSLANYIYAHADSVCAVSETYGIRALEVNKKVNSGVSIYLGTRLAEFDKYAKQPISMEKDSNEIWLAYIGTLGHSYDLTLVFDAIKILTEQKIQNLKFIVMGDGPLRNQFEKDSASLPVFFTGKLPYSEMVALLSKCDISVNPIKSGSAGSIINKVGDYAAAGLPVINTQECPEYWDMVESKQIGINCENGNSEQMAEAIKLLLDNQELRKEFGANNRKLAEDQFDREKSYPLLVEAILG